MAGVFTFGDVTCEVLQITGSALIRAEEHHPRIDGEEAPGGQARRSQDGPVTVLALVSDDVVGLAEAGGEPGDGGGVVLPAAVRSR